MTPAERATLRTIIESAVTILAASQCLDDGGFAQDVEAERIAAVFAGLDDDHQAKFFVHVARIAKTWGAGRAEMQAHLIGGHLRRCECSTDDAREFVRWVVDGMGPK